MTGGASRLRPSQKKYRRRAIFRIDGLVRQRALRIEIRELGAKLLVGRARLMSDSIFIERRDNPVARKHG